MDAAGDAPLVLLPFFLDRWCDRLLIPMKKSRQSLMRRPTCTSTLTSVALAVCLLLGPGFCVSNFAAQSYAKADSYFENCHQPDFGVSGLKRQVPTQDKAPRRHASFSALPTAVELGLSDVSGERTIAEVRCDSLTAASHQNDRAPPA